MELSHAHSLPRLRGRSTAAAPPAILPGAVVAALLGAYVVLVPSLSFLPGVGLYNEKRLLQGVLLAGAVLALLSSERLRARWLEAFAAWPRAARVALGLLFLLGVVSALRAPLPAYGLLQVGHVALLFVVAGVVAGVVREGPAAWSRFAVGAVALCVVLYLVTFAVGYASYRWGDTLLWPEAAIGFSNIRFFNQLQTWTLPFVVLPSLFWGRRSRLRRVAWLVPAAGWWMLLFASGGRGTTLALIAAAVVAALLFGRAARPWLKRQALAFAAGGGLFFVLFGGGTAAPHALTERGLGFGGRLEMWETALTMMREAPLLGAGPLHYAYFPLGSGWGHPHNAVMQWGAEWGVPAVLLVLALVGWGFRAWAKHARRIVLRCVRQGPHAKVVHVALTAALTAGAVHALVSGVLVMPLSQLLLACVVGWAWGRMLLHQPEGETPTPLGHRVLGVALVLVLCAVAWGAAQDVGALEARQADFIEEHAPGGRRIVLHPRYWQQGFFGY